MGFAILPKKMEVLLTGEHVCLVRPPKLYLFVFALISASVFCAAVAVTYGLLIIISIWLFAIWLGYFLELRKVWRRFGYRAFYLYMLTLAAAAGGYMLRSIFW